MNQPGGSIGAVILERSGQLRAGISGLEAHAVLWAMTGPDWYAQLVFERRWSPTRYEELLGQALVNVLLNPVQAAPHP